MLAVTWAALAVLAAISGSFIVLVINRIDQLRIELGARITSLDEKVDGVRIELGARISGVDEKVDAVRMELGARISGVDEKVDNRSDRMEELLLTHLRQEHHLSA